MKYTHIIFDVDGTLIDTEYAILHSLQDTLKTITGKKPEIDTLTFVLGITGEDALKEMGMKNIPEIIALWIKNTGKYNNTVSLFKGITETLDALSQSGCKLGIATSKPRNEFENEFCHFGIRHYFSTTICADDTTEHKPTPAPLIKYMELEKTTPDHLLYIGDSRYDRECAKNAGVDFALAGWGCHDTEIQTDYYLSDPKDLLSLINTR